MQVQVEVHSSDHHYWISLCWPRSTLTLCQRTSWLNHWSAGDRCLVGWIMVRYTWRVKLHYFPGEQFFPPVCIRSYTSHRWGWYIWGNVLIVVSGTPGCGTPNHESCGLSEHYFGPVAPLYAICIPSWKHNFSSGQRSMSQELNCAAAISGT